jgi:tetratricopeptide (TPR) repeat protein
VRKFERRRTNGVSLARPLLLVLLLSFTPAPAEEDPEVIHLDPDETVLEPLPSDDAEAEIVSPHALVPMPTQGVDAKEILTGLWFKQRAFRERGQLEEAARQVEVALEFMRREGLRTAPEIAAAFVAQGRRDLDNGDYPTAKDSFTLATRFQPTLTGAHLGLGLTLLQGERDIGGALGAWWNAVLNLFIDPGSLYFLAANGVLIGYVAACLGFIVALLVLVIRSTPAFFHDLQERSSGRLSEDTSRLLGWTLIALPLFLPLSPAWAIAAWGALFVAYLRPSEKLVAAGALLLLTLAGPVGLLLGWTFGTAVDPGARALIQTARHGPDLQHEAALIQLSADHPEEVTYPFLLATGYRTGGRFDDAMVMYRRVLEVEPRHARAMVNLGNLYAIRQEFAVAQRYYQGAWSSDPSLALAHYNSHLAHLEVFHLEAADEELRAARQLDEARLNELLQQGSEAGARRVPIDTGYTASEIWARVVDLHSEGSASLELTRAVRAPATLAGGIGLVALLILPGIGVVPRHEVARRCRRCGRPYCRRCQVASRSHNVCSQCTHLFILRDGVAPGVKAKKMEDVARYRKRHFLGARIMALALPGGGHVLGGRTWFGCALLVIWVFALCGLVLRGRVLISPEEMGPGSWPGMLLGLILLALLAWLGGNLSRHESRRE